MGGYEVYLVVQGQEQVLLPSFINDEAPIITWETKSSAEIGVYQLRLYGALYRKGV